MADSPKFYRAVDGITDGMVHHPSGEVFPATDTLDAHFATSGGKNGDRVLYESASKEDFDIYSAENATTSVELVKEDGSVPLGAGAPSGFDVVGGGVYADPAANHDAPVEGVKVTTLPDGTPLEVAAGDNVNKSIDQAVKDGAVAAPAPAATTTVQSTTSTAPTATSTTASGSASTNP